MNSGHCQSSDKKQVRSFLSNFTQPKFLRGFFAHIFFVRIFCWFFRSFEFVGLLSTLHSFSVERDDLGDWTDAFRSTLAEQDPGPDLDILGISDEPWRVKRRLVKIRFSEPSGVWRLCKWWGTRCLFRQGVPVVPGQVSRLGPTGMGLLGKCN